MGILTFLYFCILTHQVHGIINMQSLAKGNLHVREKEFSDVNDLCDFSECVPLGGV